MAEVTDNTVHFLGIDERIRRPNGAKSGPIVYLIACGAEFRVGSAGTSVRKNVTCQNCLSKLEELRASHEH